MKIVTALAALTLLTTGAVHAASDTKSTTGTQCRPEYAHSWIPEGWDNLRYGATGVVNQHATGTAYLNCPLPSDGSSYLDGSLYVHVRAGGTAATVECRYVVDVPDYWNRVPIRSVSVPAFGSAVLKWEGIVPNWLAYVNCKLPPGFKLGLIRRVEPVDTSE